MKRKIISIDQGKCDGCGHCAAGCPEGALKIINGKARLVGELYCDGLGACLGSCPRGAMTVEEREAEPYDETRTMENIVKGGAEVIREHLHHLVSHGQEEYAKQAVSFLKARNIPVPAPALPRARQHHGHACPGSRTVDRREAEVASRSARQCGSELRQWPVQLALLNPDAPYFCGADLLVAADCVPFAQADFHQELLRGKTLAVFCPKLDSDLEGYVEKLAEIFRRGAIRSVTVAHMEVPCCFGAGRMVEEALKRSGADMPVEDVTIAIDGKIKGKH